MRKGRRPRGARLAEDAGGSALARRRLRGILETISGEKSVGEVCAELGIGEAAFYKLRTRWLSDAASALEPRQLGRPPSQEPEEQPGEVARLKEELAELRRELLASQVREELAVALPHVVGERPKAAKKNRKDRRRLPSR